MKVFCYFKSMNVNFRHNKHNIQHINLLVSLITLNMYLSVKYFSLCPCPFKYFSLNGQRRRLNWACCSYLFISICVMLVEQGLRYQLMPYTYTVIICCSIFHDWIAGNTTEHINFSLFPGLYLSKAYKMI